MREKAHLIPAEKTRRLVKSPTYRLLLATMVALICYIAVPQTVHAYLHGPYSIIDMGNKSTFTASMTWYPAKTAVNRNNCHLKSDIIEDIRDDFVKDYQEKHPRDNSGAASTAFYEAINKLKIKNTNPSVLDAHAGVDCIVIDLKKAGNTTITLKGKLLKKNINIKVHITSYKYERPFTSLKIKGKSYKNAFKDYADINILKWNPSTKTFKMQLKPKKDWSLQGQTYKSNLYPYWKMVKKSGNTLYYKLVTPKEGDGYIPSFCFSLHNKKKNLTIRYTIMQD